MDLNDMKLQLWDCLADYGISGIYLSHNYGYLDPDNKAENLRMYAINNHTNEPVCPYTLVWIFSCDQRFITYNVSIKLISIVKHSLHYADTSILLTNSTFPDKLKDYINKINTSFDNNANIGMKIIDSKSRIII